MTSGDAQGLRTLLQDAEAAINVNEPIYHFRETMLHCACRRGLADVVRVLLERPELDLNVVDIFSRTPLMEARAKGGAEVEALLLADPRILPDFQPSRQPFTFAVDLSTGAVSGLA